MKAWAVQKYGGPEVVERANHTPKPVPPPGHVLLRGLATAINPLDWKIRSGAAKAVFPVTFPYIPGLDYVGIVEAAGLNASKVPLGTRVHGFLDPKTGGGLAEYACANAAHFVEVPPEMADDEAAGLPLAGCTALQAIRDYGEVTDGVELLVIGATGGVGHLAVQIAKALGARVSAVCGPGNAEWVRQLGAEQVFDYQATPDYLHKGKWHVIFDTVGAHSFAEAKERLRARGTYVSTLAKGNFLLDRFVAAPLGGHKASVVMVQHHAEDLKYLQELWLSGHLRVSIDSTYPLAKAPEAIAQNEIHRVRGKVIVRIREESPAS